MAKVITLSSKFPSYHPLKGKPTYFVEKFYNWYFKNAELPDGFNGVACVIDVLKHMNPNFDYALLEAFVDTKSKNVDSEKLHTIRAGYRFKPGDLVSVRVWGNDINPKSGRSGPYHSKQIVLAQDLPVDLFKFDMDMNGVYAVNDKYLPLIEGIPDDMDSIISANDGLTDIEMFSWFMKDWDNPNEFHGQIISWGKVDY